jgi:hypothetical protein
MRNKGYVPFSYETIRTHLAFQSRVVRILIIFLETSFTNYLSLVFEVFRLHSAANSLSATVGKVTAGTESKKCELRHVLQYLTFQVNVQ